MMYKTRTDHQFEIIVNLQFGNPHLRFDIFSDVVGFIAWFCQDGLQELVVPVTPWNWIGVCSDVDINCTPLFL